MRLTGQQKEILKEGILEAYAEDELKILLSEKMDLNYGSIARGDDYTSKVANLIEKLEADGKAAEFIRVIVEKKPNSPHLEEIRKEFKKFSNQEEIPFVIVAMTNTEAQDLIKKLESSEDSNSKLSAFRQIIQIITNEEKQQFLQNYSNKRCEWKPYSEINKTTMEIIENTINLYNEESFKITHCEYSEECFNTDENKRYSTWEYLKEIRCILIIDPISLFSEHICKCLTEAEILSRTDIGIAIIMPQNSKFLEVDKLIKEASNDTPLSRAYKRFETNYFDINCEIGIRNELNLQRWCFSILPKIVESVSENKPDAIKKKIRREFWAVNEKESNTDMRNLILGNEVHNL
jgi:glutaredoxin-related protein